MARDYKPNSPDPALSERYSILIYENRFPKYLIFAR